MPLSRSLPGGPNLDELGADWPYLTVPWSAAENPISDSACSYELADLDSLLDRSQLEVWLFGYRATDVRELDKAQADRQARPAWSQPRQANHSPNEQPVGIPCATWYNIINGIRRRTG